MKDETEVKVKSTPEKSKSKVKRASDQKSKIDEKP